MTRSLPLNLDTQKVAELYKKLSSLVKVSSICTSSHIYKIERGVDENGIVLQTYKEHDSVVPQKLLYILHEFLEAQKDFIYVLDAYLYHNGRSIAEMNKVKSAIDICSEFMISTKDNADSFENVFPPKVRDIVEHDFYEAQKRFIYGIDTYMHQSKLSIVEFNTVKTIIDVCPEFLMSKDGDGDLPLHCAVGYYSTSNSAATYATLFAESGNLEFRGGILIENHARANVLQKVRHHAVYKALEKSNPKLFFKEDIHDYDLFHLAVISRNYDMAKWLLSICTSSLHEKDKYFDNCLPIHYAIVGGLDLVQLCLEDAIKYDQNCSSIGFLFESYNNKLIIDALIDKYGNDGHNCIAEVFSKHKNIPILQKIIKHAPQYTINVVINCPHTCFVRDQNGRLAIHVALAEGMKQSTALLEILNSSIPCLEEIDPLTALFPSALAAAESSCDLETIYSLMQMHPCEISGMTSSL